jgi:hypothetical protein
MLNSYYPQRFHILEANQVDERTCSIVQIVLELLQYLPPLTKVAAILGVNILYRKIDKI